MIALLDVEAKYYATLILEDLKIWATEPNRIPFNQTGVQAGLGTTTNILITAMLMKKSPENEK